MKKILLLILCITLLCPASLISADTVLPTDVVPVEEPAPSAANLSKPLGSDAKIAEGDYYLYPQLSNTRVITIVNGTRLPGGNAYLYKYSGADKQLFHIKPMGNGTYTIQNVRSSLVLEAANGGKANKTNVQQGTDTGAAYQRWYIFKKGNSHVIQSAYSQKVLYISGNKDVAKSNLCIYKYTASAGQRFTLKKKAAAKRKYKTNTRVWNDTRDYDILTNIIGAVESGGQVYGNRDYASYEPPYANSSLEHTITLGWAQFYGVEAQKLIQNIYNRNPAKFKAIDKKNRIQKMLSKDWVAIRWNPNTKQKKILIQLITSDIGRTCQDELFKSYMVGFVNDCKRLYTTNAWGVHMYCQIRHLGGPGGAKRIFDRCAGDYSLDSIMNALKKDQSDGSSSYQVGDNIFWSRHVKCCEFLQQYAM